MTRKVKVIHKPGGYEAYKDQIPIRKPNWHMIAIMVGFIFICGVISALLLSFVPQFFTKSKAQPQTPITSIEDVLQPRVTVDLASIISQPLPTATVRPSATLTPEFTGEPTVNLQATVEYVSGQLSEMQTQTAMPTITLLPIETVIATSTPLVAATERYSHYAVVIYNNVIIRASSGQQYNPLDMAYRGQQFPVIDTYNGWVQIKHPDHNPAWIAAHLVRIDEQ